MGAGAGLGGFGKDKKSGRDQDRISKAGNKGRIQYDWHIMDRHHDEPAAHFPCDVPSPL